jgi:hypothetical protein
MAISLIGANVVLLAKNHNPTIVSKDWLSEKGILTESAMSFTHTPAFSVVETDNFSFIVDPDRLQLTAKKDFDVNVNTLAQMVLAYIHALPETPYSAIGFNFGYKIEDGESILQKIYGSVDRLTSLFPEEYQLGGMIQFKYKALVGKLVLQPQSGGIMIADFNFHYPIKEDTDIEQAIGMHAEAMAESHRILGGLIDE